MNVNKRIDRLKQWGKERMGGEIRTDTNNDFKALEIEMQLRHDGMERLHRSANAYIKSIAKRDQGDDKDKQLPVAYFGSAMLSHGDDFEPDSEFGQCLSSLGRANERIARMQDTYVANANSSWLESLERSLVQMKGYQTAKKKLESRRLAFDTAQSKIEKSRKEDFRMEEELRSQKAKYEESSDDVLRRMQDIKEAEVDSIADLTSFLEAELAYYDRCREVLLQVKKDWPRTLPHTNGHRTASLGDGSDYQSTRSRSNTGSSLTDRFTLAGADDEPLDLPPRLNSRYSSAQSSPRRELPGFDLPVRSSKNCTRSGFEGPTSLAREVSPSSIPPMSRRPTDPTDILNARSNLRSSRQHSGSIAEDDKSQLSSLDWSTAGQNGSTAARRTPPPPPPSRSKKPPPPPPPMKRSALSTSEIPRY